MRLRDRIAAALLPLVQAHAPQCLGDAWGRDEVMVILPALTIAPVAGRPGAQVAGLAGRVQVRFMHDDLLSLPDESLWRACASVRLAAGDDDQVRVHRLTLAEVAEGFTDTAAYQDLFFSLQADLLGGGSEAESS